jgi:hypothetical protein
MINALLNLFYSWSGFLQFSTIIIMSGFVSYLISFFMKVVQTLLTTLPIIIHGWPTKNVDVVEELDDEDLTKDDNRE